jgi:hypothetical protein
MSTIQNAVGEFQAIRACPSSDGLGHFFVFGTEALALFGYGQTTRLLIDAASGEFGLFVF